MASRWVLSRVPVPEMEFGPEALARCWRKRMSAREVLQGGKMVRLRWEGLMECSRNPVVMLQHTVRVVD